MIDFIFGSQLHTQLAFLCSRKALIPAQTIFKALAGRLFSNYKNCFDWFIIGQKRNFYVTKISFLNFLFPIDSFVLKC